MPLTPPATGMPPQVGPRFQTGPGDTSDPVQPYASGAALATGKVITVNYSCKLHSGENGRIQVVADFLSQNIVLRGILNQLPDATLGLTYTPIALTTGGLAPYSSTLSDAVIPKGLAVKNENTGVFVSGTPVEIGENFAFTVHCQDSLGNAVDQTYTIAVLPAGPIVTEEEE